MQNSSNITCYKTIPKNCNYEGKLKKWGGSQAKASATQRPTQNSEWSRALRSTDEKDFLNYRDMRVREPEIHNSHAARDK